MLKQSLSQKMLQKLSPQQIQLMKLLQIPTATLEQRIKEELEANPALEEGEERDEIVDLAEEQGNDDFDDEPYELDDYLNEYIEDDPTTYKTQSNNYSADEEDKTVPIAVEHSFHEYLEEQVGLMQLEDERKEAIALQIVGSIDEDGYLRREPDSIIDDLMFAQNIFADEAEILGLLKQIQRFEPPGIGARDLQECLLIQLEIKAEQDDEEDFLDFEEREDLDLAIKVIRDYFDEFTKKHYDKLLRRLDITNDDLKAAIDEIIKLNPKPASGFSSGGNSRANQYVVPDFIIQNRDGELELTLNSRNAPDLCVSDQYQDMLRSYKKKTAGRRNNKQEREAIMFIKQKIDSARWFIDAIRQRQDTMYRTMYAILQYQYDFFLTGDSTKLKPMILKDIADITGLDISTISRVANSKFVQTEFGTKRLKEFFSESMSKEDGEEVSTLEVKQILEDIIGQENKKKPLSDQKLQKALEDKGYQIARRTVAKYREQLNIPVARLRKEL
ncbi:RNA polymerase factor sigma-54 [Phaeodactylibacter xiamenensis]|jgi:RNA polymerase sigma-54 factor|uniref:RNA polymerase factor sigma-54 n=1 Tax=Phaeodactylibacter xiamenensis TaxID=1524460 RepID=UPI0024A8DB79|nr:RNA polymerase factor sigma-54 [Phaeodactylibacter xiamenensis]